MTPYEIEIAERVSNELEYNHVISLAISEYAMAIEDINVSCHDNMIFIRVDIWDIGINVVDEYNTTVFGKRADTAEFESSIKGLVDRIAGIAHLMML